jgi:hypothetical protein|tara:strand:+ start:3170 stop:3946 length:777 start_codon:yes stop_codon:yes gene_type:complete
VDPLFAIVGFLVGLCVGLTGVGGGALMTPILILGFGIPMTLAVGTDLCFASVTKACGVWFHRRKGNVRWYLVGRLALGSIPATLITVYLLDSLEPDGTLETVISYTLSAMLVITSLVLLMKERIQRRISLKEPERNHWIHQHRDNLLTLLGAMLGVLVTLSSVGAGALTAVILFLLYPRMPVVAVVGTDLAHAVPLAALAGFGHFELGNVDIALLGSLLLGSIPGTAIGSQLGFYLPEHVLRRWLAGILLLTGLKFAF